VFDDVIRGKSIRSLCAGILALPLAVAACSGATTSELFGSGAEAQRGGSSPSGSGTSSESDTPETVTKSDVTPDAGSMPCTPGDATTCAPDEYCKVVACAGAGACAKRSQEPSPAYDAQCGCDGITYWNAELAAQQGINVAAAGPCLDTAKKCTGKKQCGEGRCNLEEPSKAQCNLLPPVGTCWQLPAKCPTDAEKGGGGGRRCAGNSCRSYCSSIHEERAFYKVTSCMADD
jgi:hypothetical protein